MKWIYWGGGPRGRFATQNSAIPIAHPPEEKSCLPYLPFQRLHFCERFHASRNRCQQICQLMPGSLLPLAVLLSALAVLLPADPRITAAAGTITASAGCFAASGLHQYCYRWVGSFTASCFQDCCFCLRCTCRRTPGSQRSLPAEWRLEIRITATVSGGTASKRQVRSDRGQQ